MMVRWAGTPSSSKPNVPSAPGIVASADDGDVVGAVAVRPALVERQEAGAGVAGLGAEDPVKLDRVAARLVDLEGGLARIEDDGRHVVGARLRGQQLDGLLGRAAGVLGQVHRLEVLVAGRRVLAAEAVRERAPLGVVLADRQRLDAGAGLDQGLLDVAAFGRGEDLADALALEGALGDGDPAHGAHRGIGRQEHGQLVVDGDRERVDLDGRAVAADRADRLAEVDGLGEDEGAGAGDLDGAAGDALDLAPLRAVTTRRSPRRRRRRPGRRSPGSRLRAGRRGGRS